MPTTDTSDAARLVAHGMRPKQIPDRDLGYRDLVRRYVEDEQFAELVRAVADGMELEVLAVTAASGIVLAPREGSVFEVRMDDYAQRTKLAGRGVDKVIHALTHLATAALAFPRPDDLANVTYVGRVSVEQVDAVVREAARQLEEKAAAAEANEDPLETAPELERVWRAYSRRSAAAVGRDGRLLPDSTRGMITKAMRYLSEIGALVPAGSEGGGTYRTTPHYRVMVGELAADAAFNELLRLGVVPITPPSGSLSTVAADTLTGIPDV